jgi:3-phenylpropionate/trans-cinnamate dioxygenase ferredoxin reductase component
VDGRRVPADVVLVAVGMRPATDWLAPSALGDNNGIVTDAAGRTMIPGVFTAGDCLSSRIRTRGCMPRPSIGTSAAATAFARSILGRPAPEPRPPYFWSDQLGTKLQMIGRTRGADSVEIEDAAPSPCFIARYRRNGRLVGLFAAGAPHAVGRARREIDATAGAPPGRRNSSRQFAYPAVKELARGAGSSSAASPTY